MTSAAHTTSFIANSHNLGSDSYAWVYFLIVLGIPVFLIFMWSKF